MMISIGAVTHVFVYVLLLDVFAGHVPGAPLRSKRTIKVLLGMSCGCWVLSYDWLQACLQAGYGADVLGAVFVYVYVPASLDAVVHDGSREVWWKCGRIGGWCRAAWDCSCRVEESPFEINDDGCAKDGPRMSRLASTRKVCICAYGWMVHV